METSYKEKYEQAIERLKQWDREHPCAGYVLSDRDKFIFPELAESEDEKIRKRLITDFGTIGKKEWGGLEVKDILAWLEKQGQVKESFISQHENKTCKENDDSLTSEDEKVRKALLELVHDTTGDELWVDYNVHKEEALDWLERQGEQKFEMKTAEESLDISSDEYNKIVDECIFGEQKPEENKGNIGGISPNWSEEDEHRLNSCLNILQPKTFVGNTETINTKWLKSLKDRVQPQPKQEWSEEDEEILRTILSDGIRGAELDMLQVNWLKSLRPQNKWKPSDEQIRALKHAFNDGSITFAEMEILATLYEGLKSII